MISSLLLRWPLWIGDADPILYYRQMRFLLACILAAVLGFLQSTALAAPDKWQGARLSELLDDINERGQRIIYSTDLVHDDHRIQQEPDLSDIRRSLPDILAPFGLGIKDGPGDSLLVVRSSTEPHPGVPAADTLEQDVPLPEIIVSSSLHRLENLHSGTHTYLDRELATRLPATAEEVVRLTNRVPGTASGGISARNHVRGGEPNEVLFLLDGLRLYEPFHMKDFQTVATIINSNAVAGIDFYTGAYPARFGDRMSGVTSMSLRTPREAMETELALSFFNTSLLSLGRLGDEDQGDWLLTARRGNLDLVVDVVDPDFGSPAYSDFLLHGGWEFGPRTRFSANYLASDDKIQLSDIERGENAEASYANRVIWLKWNADWNSTWQSETIFSFSDISNDRVGALDLPGVVLGTIDDEREFRVTAIRQDWRTSGASNWFLGFGFDAKHLDGNYRFESTQFIFDPFDSIFDNEAMTQRSSRVTSDGAQYGVYAELRWQPIESLALDLGVRWDHQSYTIAASDEQSSPRIGLLYQIARNTELRLGWGQFSQAQEVNELQLSDGIEAYFPAQRAEHIVANLQHRFNQGATLDVSAYRKSFRTLRPRFENAFNTLTLVPEIQFDRVRIDASSAESRGAEIMLSQQSSEHSLTWWAGYAWASVEDTVENARIRRSWDQTHTGKAGLSWRWGQWNFSFAGEVHTGWPKTRLNAETVTLPGGEEQLVLETTPINGQRHSVFHTVDTRISRDFDVTHGSLNVFLDVTNLYDRANPCCTEYSLASDENGSDILLSRETHWLPLVPSLGVIWQF